jgi:hypothetical protein
LFACETAEDASIFIESEKNWGQSNSVEYHETKRRGESHIYEVEAAGFWRSPMALVGEIKNRLANRGEVELYCEDLEALISEYWFPGPQWSFFEYFGPTFTILRRVNPDEIERMKIYERRISYDADRQRSKNMKINDRTRCDLEKKI